MNFPKGLMILTLMIGVGAIVYVGLTLISSI